MPTAKIFPNDHKIIQQSVCNFQEAAGCKTTHLHEPFTCRHTGYTAWAVYYSACYQYRNSAVWLAVSAASHVFTHVDCPLFSLLHEVMTVGKYFLNKLCEFGIWDLI